MQVYLDQATAFGEFVERRLTKKEIIGFLSLLIIVIIADCKAFFDLILFDFYNLEFDLYFYFQILVGFFLGLFSQWYFNLKSFKQIICFFLCTRTFILSNIIARIIINLSDRHLSSLIFFPGRKDITTTKKLKCFLTAMKLLWIQNRCGNAIFVVDEIFTIETLRRRLYSKKQIPPFLKKVLLTLPLLLFNLFLVFPIWFVFGFVIFIGWILYIPIQFIYLFSMDFPSCFLCFEDPYANLQSLSNIYEYCLVSKNAMKDLLEQNGKLKIARPKTIDLLFRKRLPKSLNLLISQLESTDTLIDFKLEN